MTGRLIPVFLERHNNEGKGVNTMAFQKGDFVRVSNGQAEPPKHHKKKHREWGYRNFDGYVYMDETETFGTVSVGPTPNSPIVFSFPTHMIASIEKGE